MTWSKKKSPKRQCIDIATYLTWESQHLIPQTRKFILTAYSHQLILYGKTDFFAS